MERNEVIASLPVTEWELICLLDAAEGLAEACAVDASFPEGERPLPLDRRKLNSERADAMLAKISALADECDAR